MPRRPEVLAAALAAVLFATLALSSLAYPAQARLLPLVIGVPGTALALLKLAMALRDQPPPAPETAAPAAATRATRNFAWFGALLAAVWIAGIAPAAGLITAAWLRLDFKVAWLKALASGAGLALALHLVFERWLELRLFGGLLRP